MASSTNRLLTCLGCLVAGPLGCIAFLGGGMAVGTYFTPELVAKFLEEDLPRGFDHTLRGQLDIGSFELSWTDEQRIEDVVVRDPEGREVLRADVRLPSLLRWLDEEHDLGEIVVELDVHVIAEASGRTNLQRAFTPNPGVKVNYSGPRRWAEVVRELLFSRRGTVRLDVREFQLVSARSIERGEPVRVSDLNATLAFGPDGPLRLSAVGSTGVGSLAIDVDASREAFDARSMPDPGVYGRVSATGVPTELVASVLGSAELLSEVFGGEMDAALTLGLLDPDGEGAPLRAELRSADERIVLDGELASAGLLSGHAVEKRLALDVELFSPPLREAWFLGLPADVVWLEERPVRITGLAFEGGAEGLVQKTPGVRVDFPAFELLPDAGGRFPLFGTTVSVLVDDAVDGGEHPGAELRLDTALSEDGTSTVSLRLETGAPGRLFRFDPDSPFRLFATASAIDVAPIDEALALDGELVALLGERAGAKVELAGSEEREPLSISVRGDSVRVELEGSLVGSPFSTENLVAELDVEVTASGIPVSVLLRALWPGLEDDAALSLEGGSSEQQPILMGYEGWRRREDAPSADPVPPGPPGVARGGDGAGASGSLSILVPRLSVVDPDLTAQGLELELRDVSFLASGDADVLRIDVTADLLRGGRVEELWTLYGLRGPFGLAGHEDAVLSATVTEAPTVLVDAKLGTLGLLGDVFGPTTTLVFRGSGLSTTGGRFKLDVAGSHAMGTLSGFHERGVRVSDAGLTLSCELDDLSFERLVRPLAPYFNPVRPAVERDTFSFRLEDGVLPLDGDPDALSGSCAVDLSPAEILLSDEVLAFLDAEGGSWGAAPATGELAFRIAEGRVHVEGLELPIRRSDEVLVLPLTGSYGFGGAATELQTELPLHAIGSEVSALLVGLGELLSPDMAVPIVITGEPGALDMTVRPQWIKTVGDVLSGMVPEVLKDNLKKLLQEKGE